MTGGGVYPALAVLQALGDKANTILWVGGEGGMEKELLIQYNIPFAAIPAAGLHGVGIPALPGNLLRLTRGWFEARKIIKEFKPDVLFFTGGFIAAPVALAGRHIPSIVFLPDIEPGFALKALIHFGSYIATSTEISKKYIPDSKSVTISGYPLRKEMMTWTREKGRTALGLSKKQRVLLVSGGSKGALSINRALFTILPELLKDMQIIHISGTANWEATQKVKHNLDKDLSKNYFTFPYLFEKMGAALASANLVVSRAGASTLGEYPYFGLPAILVPYPYSWRYQKSNAQYLVENGGALMITNEELPTHLLGAIKNLMSDYKHLSSMKKAMHKLSNPNAAEKIAAIIINISQSEPKKGAIPAW